MAAENEKLAAQREIDQAARMADIDRRQVVTRGRWPVQHWRGAALTCALRCTWICSARRQRRPRLSGGKRRRKSRNGNRRWLLRRPKRPVCYLACVSSRLDAVRFRKSDGSTGLLVTCHRDCAEFNRLAEIERTKQAIAFGKRTAAFERRRREEVRAVELRNLRRLRSEIPSLPPAASVLGSALLSGRCGLSTQPAEADLWCRRGRSTPAALVGTTPLLSEVSRCVAGGWNGTLRRMRCRRSRRWSRSGR